MLTKTADKAIFYCLLLYALASSISIAAANIAISFALLFAVIRYAKQSFELRADRWLIKVVLVFWAMILISALFAYDHDVAFSKLWAYIYRGAPLFLAICFIDSRKKLFAVVITMAMSIGIADLYAIWQGFHGMPRAKAFSHYMAFAGNLIQMIPVVAVLALEEKRLALNMRIVLGVISLLSLLALLFNATRGAWIAIFVAAGSYILVSLFAKRRQAAIALCILMAISAGVFCYSPILQSRGVSLIDFSTNGENSERLLLWRNAWRMFVGHPVVGVGPGNFRDIHLGHYITPESKEQLGHAHNNFLQILAENGIIGFAGFVSMFTYILVFLYRKGIVRREPLALAVFLATLTLLLQGLTEFNYGDSAVIRMYWFLLGLAAIAPKEEIDTWPVKSSIHLFPQG